MNWTSLFAFLIGIVGCAIQSESHGQESLAEALADPVISNFLGDDDFGTQHAEAPEETTQFGQLVGIWHVEQEVLDQNGWVSEPSALWAWQFALGGFATQDLWYQKKDSLAGYLGISGRDYLLTALRIFDAKSGEWKIGWASNGAGQTPGQDGGSLTATKINGDLILSGPPFETERGIAHQRIIFGDISPDSFKWSSEFSTNDGQSWSKVMRVSASRLK